MRWSLSILALSLAAGSATAQQAEPFTLQGGEVAVYNLAGAVSVEAGTGAVTVQVTRGGADAARLAVEQGEIAGRETLRIRYPGDRLVYEGLGSGSSTTLGVREDGTFGDGGRRDGHDHERHSPRRDGRRVRISGAGEGLRAHADLRIQLPPGRDLAVYLAVGRVSVANVNGRLHVDAHSAPVTASGVRGELSVDVGSGSVNVTGAEGVLSVDTGSGPVEVSRFNGSGLTVDTGSGEVTATEVVARDIGIETGSGDIRVSAATAPVVRLETGSGGVTADLRAEPATLAVETGSGDIAVTAPASLGAQVEIETASGDIETDFALQVTRHARSHLVGQIGSGRGRIEIETGSGDVRLMKRAS